MSSEKEKIAELPAKQLCSAASNNANNDQKAIGDVSRRSFLRLSALAGAGVSMVGPAPRVARATPDQSGRLEEATVAELQAEMTAGRLNSVALTNFYLNRIRTLDQNGPGVNSIIELNPAALSIARDADAMRRGGTVLSPLHGIPVLLKDNIDTGDGMQTTAGSFALAGQPAAQDSTVASKLRAGGAVILGKTNLSEWANFRSFFSTSGWSGRGGLTHNPYSLDRNACGSSSGSAAAVSSNFAAIGLGTETDGSIVCPGNANGVVGIKPTVGLTSRAGVVPISHTQDTVGPHGRTVADAAAVLNVIVSRTADPRDPATAGVPLGWQGTGKSRPTLPADYTAFLDPNGLNGTRVGVTRQGIDNAPPQVVAVFDAAVAAIASAGATVVDLDGSGFTFAPADGEFLILLFEFKLDVQQYFATRIGVPMAGKTLADAIVFNNVNAATEMPYFFQEIFELAELMDTSGPDPGNNPQPIFGGLTYNQALAIDHNAGVNGIDAALIQFNLDAVVAPTDSPGWTTDLILSDHFLFASSGLAAGPGYPIVQVPAGNVNGMPQGISFLGTAFSEPTLIKLASGFEAVTHARIVPTFTGNITTANTAGTRVMRLRTLKDTGLRPHRI
ncbi:MAG TPA: amidase [Blastocatellia bacterium]|nr:amidase [Blastocatellia bacterium]